MGTRRYQLSEAKTHLSRLLRDVAGGNEVIITKAGRPLARLSPVEEVKPNIRFGVLKGKATVSDDFDAPLPDDVLSEFEGSPCGC